LIDSVAKLFHLTMKMLM